jgi:hypothetical protein
VKIGFGRGLKAIDETVISDSIKTRERDNKLDTANTTNINSKLHNIPPMFHDNSSTSQDWHNNTIAGLINIFHRGASDQSVKKVPQLILTNTDDDEDLEVAEQKYVNHQAPRIKRTAPSYRAFYDDMSQRNSEEANRNLDSDSFQLSNILEDRSDGLHVDGHAAPHWSNDIQDLDPYFKMPRSTNSRKRKKKPGKTNKHSSDKHAKKSNLHSSLSRNRRHHTHRFDVSKNADRGDWRKKDRSEASSSTGHTEVQKSRTAEQGYLRAGINDKSDEKVLYENAEDQSVSKRTIGDRAVNRATRLQREKN